MHYALFLLYVTYHTRAGEETHSCISQVMIVYKYLLISLVGRVFANGPGDQGSIPGRVIPKTFKMGLDTSLFNT